MGKCIHRQYGVIWKLYKIIPVACFYRSMNDGEEEKIAEFVKKLNSVKAFRLLPYHNYAEEKYESLGLCYPLADIPLPSKDEIALVTEKIKACGVKNVYYNGR